MITKGIVVAVGGNALIRDKHQISVESQSASIQESSRCIAALVDAGYTPVITHGNGPQVGFLLRRAELALDELPALPLDVLGADTQGATGYLFTRNLRGCLAERGIDRQVVAVVTQPVRDLDVARFAAEDDPGRSDAAAVMLLEDAHPQMAVEEDGESRRHCCLQVRRSGPDDAGFLTGARRRARAGCHPDFLPGSAIRAPGTDGVIISLLAQRRGGCLESARVKAFAHAGAHGSFVTVDDAIVVRRATVPDVSALVALREEMFRMTGTAMTDGRWRGNARRWFLERIRNPIYGIFVVQADREVVACAMGAVRDAAPSPEVPDGRDVLVSNVCTLPAHRGHGHGRRAFEAVMRWAASTGIGRAELMATEAGQGMYEQTGFTLNKFPAMRADLRAC